MAVSLLARMTMPNWREGTAIMAEIKPESPPCDISTVSPSMSRSIHPVPM
jgi:hypothetical protein